MHQEQLAQEIKKLATDQRLSLVQEIWDSIALDNDSLLLPDWQKRELDYRYQQYKDGLLELHDCNDVHKMLRAKTQ